LESRKRWPFAVSNLSMELMSMCKSLALRRDRRLDNFKSHTLDDADNTFFVISSRIVAARRLQHQRSLWSADARTTSQVSSGTDKALKTLRETDAQGKVSLALLNEKAGRDRSPTRTARTVLSSLPSPQIRMFLSCRSALSRKCRLFRSVDTASDCLHRPFRVCGASCDQ
jgi:hypothetical protein